jgi:hypothetical protein
MKPMKKALSFVVCMGAAFSLICRAHAFQDQTTSTRVGLEQALGKWQSTEQYENESRITVAFRSKGQTVEGWALLLGQHRKDNDRATLGLSFSEASWDGQRFLFNTVLPEDEGTIGWELRPSTATTAVLKALTEDGQPMQDDDLRWTMKK